jgi:hypothetical protein
MGFFVTRRMERLCVSPTAWHAAPKSAPRTSLKLVAIRFGNPARSCSPSLSGPSSSTLVTIFFDWPAHRFFAAIQRRFVHARCRSLSCRGALSPTLGPRGGTGVERDRDGIGGYARYAAALNFRRVLMRLRRSESSCWMHEDLPHLAARIAMGAGHLCQAAHENVASIAGRRPTLFAFRSSRTRQPLARAAHLILRLCLMLALPPVVAGPLAAFWTKNPQFQKPRDCAAI